MAILIQSKNKAIKSHALRASLVIPINRILSSSYIDSWESIAKKYAQFEQEIRDLINKYQALHVNKGLLAFRRGQINQRYKIIADLLAHALAWQKNISSETEAIVNLAEKIAETMLNSLSKLSASPEFHQQVFNKLKEYFYINIILPKELYFLSKDFAYPTLLTLSQHAKEAEATLCINRQVHIINLADINLERILR